MEFHTVDKSKTPVPVKVTEYLDSTEPLELYAERYSSKIEEEYSVLNKINRYLSLINTLDNYYGVGSSMLLIGSGHPVSCALFTSALNLEKVYAYDLVEEAGDNLPKNVKFICGNVLDQKLPNVDFAFSSHTLEHFTPEELHEFIPKLFECVNNVVIIVVPYKDLGWGGEPNHKVEFSEDDEIAHYFDEYAIIHNGVELVLVKYKDNQNEWIM